MKIKYFQDTDTLYIEFRPAEVAETRDLDENTLLDIDREGNICAITVEHASDRAGILGSPDLQRLGRPDASLLEALIIDITNAQCATPRDGGSAPVTAQRALAPPS